MYASVARKFKFSFGKKISLTTVSRRYNSRSTRKTKGIRVVFSKIAAKLYIKSHYCILFPMQETDHE